MGLGLESAIALRAVRKGRKVRAACAAGVWASVLAGILARAEAPPPVVFVDAAKAAGVAFQHTFGDEDMSSILESTGSGCAFLDADGDGHIDIYFVNGCYVPGVSDEDSDEKDTVAKNRLFRNRGDGTFEDITDKSGAGDPRFGMAAVCADYDVDGDTDIYVTNYGRNTLYRNDGKGNFTDVTEEAGVGCTLWSVGAVFLDYDRDGDCDLYVGNYLKFDPEYRLYYEADEFPGPLSYPGQPDVLYRNDGDGTFTDVTKEAGVANKGRAMGVIAADFDGDGRVDIYVANDAMENYLYHNEGDGTFSDTGLMSGTAFSANGDSSASMGGEFGDFDADGDLDL
ncbi:MAG: VCBS repeat-containing protein, partial [Planctomycetes bacterium]|nr:VCBS repeat-containing protein [Planctomycetota bacterium]